MNNEENTYVESLSRKEQCIYFKGIAFGQRMAGATLLDKFSAIDKDTKPALMKLIMTDINKFLNILANMSSEIVEKAYGKDIDIE